MDREKRFDWPLCYAAENLVLSRLEAFLSRNSFARDLAARMNREAGTLLLDWIDSLTWPDPDGNAAVALADAGYVREPALDAPAGLIVWQHPEAMLPSVLTPAEASAVAPMETLALRCDSVVEFLATHRISERPEGAPLSRFRRAVVSVENNACLEVVERRGYRGFEPGPHPASPGRTEGPDADAILTVAELWRTRPREFVTDADGFHQTLELLDAAVARLGRDLACHVIFAEERAYWQRRNRAAAVQKARQDALGLGWANHDHHTFRSSREQFRNLMTMLERLGFERRERYYAGAEAGWGAQVLEQTVEGLVAFCDVDLLPHETEIDFSRQPLPPAPRLGTIGLWVGLHGESALGAGLHHLECRFDYEQLREQLAACGIVTMKPFSDFPFLRQAFTEGERWPVARARAERLHRAGLINGAQLEQFARDGAIGSHLENLQRKGGFKGFNQKSVSVIIAATDPRKA